MSRPTRGVEVMSVPIDLGAGRRGADTGPSAIRITGLQSPPEALGLRAADFGDLDVVDVNPVPDDRDPTRALAVEPAPSLLGKRIL